MANDPITVFISYTHESPAFRSQVGELAAWLEGQGCKMLCDHQYPHDAPTKGWLVWMKESIRDAAVVLVVCSPKYKDRFEKNTPVGDGKGVAFEGAHITKAIYETSGRNNKFYAVLPDGGEFDDIPEVLREWANDRQFPSGRDGILALIRKPNRGEPSPLASGSVPTPTPLPADGRGNRATREEKHLQVAATRLGRPGAQPFLALLHSKLIEQGVLTGADSCSVATVLARFAPSAKVAARQLCWAVQHAMNDPEMRRLSGPAREEVADAAAAMYMLGICRCVDDARTMGSSDASVADSGNFLFRLGSYDAQVHDTGAQVLAIVLATVLVGGEVRLAANARRQYVPKDAFVLDLTGYGDRRRENFERAVFPFVVPPELVTQGVREGTGELSPAEHDLLKISIEAMHSRAIAFVLVVPGMSGFESYLAGFAKEHRVPVALPEGGVGKSLFGIEPNVLLAMIRIFWSDLATLRGEMHGTKGAAGREGVATGKGATIVNNFGTLALSQGANSPAVAGTVSRATVAGSIGPTMAQLGPVLTDLVKAVAAYPQAPSALIHQAVAASAEAAKGDKADPGVIRTALDRIAVAVVGFEATEAIVKLVNWARSLLDPVEPPS